MGVNSKPATSQKSHYWGNVARGWIKRADEAQATQKKQGMLDAFQRKIDEGPAPKAMTRETAPTQLGEVAGFDAMRRRTEQRATADTQTGVDALTRRLAAAGVLNSGAGIKALKQAQDQGAQAKQDAVQGVEFQGNQALRQEQEAVKQRNFVRDQADAEAAFQDKVFRADQSSRIFQLGQNLDSLSLQKLQLNLAQEESRFNQKMAEWEKQHTGGLFGGGGFLGLGI